MQQDLFGTISPERTAYRNEVAELFDWRSAIAQKQEQTRQMGLLPQGQIEQDILVYKSGASNKSDILGYMKAKSAIGVCVMDTSAPVRSLISQYTSDGHKCFVDSGAFRAFMSKLKDSTSADIDFEIVRHF